MDNFNIQKFIKESKDEYYSKLYKGSTRKILKEGQSENDDRIEGLLNIKLKQAFLDSGKALIDDLLTDDEFEISDITNHLANELHRYYGYDLREGGREDDEDDNFDDKSIVKEISMNASDLETAMALLGGMLGLPAVAILSQKAQDKLKAMKAKGKEALTEEEGVDVDIEDEVPGMDIDLETTAEQLDTKQIFSQLVDAYDSAKQLGDEKLTRQLANTITYFNKTIIFGEPK